MKKFLLIFTITLILALTGLTLYAFLPRPYTYDIEKANEFITSKAHRRSQGLCAFYVRKALEAGGCCMWGHPHSAKGYADFLTALEFSKVDRKGYRRQKGDIVVFNSTKGHPYGHIAIWNGKQWVSDFRQRSFYVAQGYRNSNDYQIFRMLKKRPQRHFTVGHHLRALGSKPFEVLGNEITSIF